MNQINQINHTAQAMRDTHSVSSGSKNTYHDGQPIFIAGMPRSGTTWVAKIFDSHPDTYYLHEPDISLRPHNLPEWPSPQPEDDILDATSRYLRALETTITARSTNKMPVFRKFYNTPLDATRRKFKLLFGRPVPPPVRRPHQDVRLVMKSVSNFNRLSLFAAAEPGTRFVALVRHPLDQISSMMRGLRMGRFGDTQIEFSWLLRCPWAKDIGLDETTLAEASESEKHAWLWALLTHPIGEPDAHNIKLVSYESICAHPMELFDELFYYVNLELHKNTAAAIRATSGATNDGRYFSINRVSKDEIGKWQTIMPRDEQKKLWDIVSRSNIMDKLPTLVAP